MGYVLSNSATCSFASSIVSPLRDIANVTSASNHCKCTVIAVIGINGSLGSANPRSGSKSVSISKNATLSLGASTFK